MNDLHFGVCVGIDRYPGLAGRDLHSARHDAAAFSAWLTDPQGGGVPQANVRLVSVPDTEPFAMPADGRPQQREVNRALREINDAIRAAVAANPAAWDSTRLYIYVAGHGIGPPNGECALLMADADRQTLGENLELSLYADWYLHCGLVREVVIFADCCREIAGGIPPANAPPFTVCAVPEHKGTLRFMGYATRLGELAYEPAGAPQPADSGRGYFTKAVLDGLRGAAAERATGAITGASLATYVQQVVEEVTRTVAPYPQRGEMIADVARQIVFRTGAEIAAGTPAQPARPSLNVTLRFPPGLAGDVVLRNGDTSEHARWAVANGPWTLPLPAGYYRVEALAQGAPPLANDGLFDVLGSDRDVQL